jgi:hypothetical protein
MFQDLVGIEEQHVGQPEPLAGHSYADSVKAIPFVHKIMPGQALKTDIKEMVV